MDIAKIVTVTLNPCIDKTVQVCAFAAGKTNRVLSSREDVGGKGINVARVLRGSGVPVLAAGVVPSDGSAPVENALRDADAQTMLLETAGRLRVNLKITDSDVGTLTELNEPGTAGADAAQELFSQLLPTLRKGDVLTLCGSLPPDADRTLYRDWIRQANAKGVRCILDADGDALRFGVEAAPYAVKPNLAEMQALTGVHLTTPRQIVPHIRRLHERGIAVVAVSLGADGLLLSDGRRILHALPFPIRVASCTGAGDAAVAMLAFAAAKDLPAETAARLACAAGTCTAATEGTQTASFAQTQTYAPQVRLIDLSTDPTQTE